MDKYRKYEICYSYSADGFARSMIVKARNKKEVKSIAYEQLGRSKEIYFSEPVLASYVY